MHIEPEQIEFDEAKSLKNLEERGLPFSIARLVLNNSVHQQEDVRKDYKEKRMIAFGILNNRLFCCVYTQRGQKYRIISLRKANSKEVEKWQP